MKAELDRRTADARLQVELAFGLDLDHLSPGESMEMKPDALDALFGAGRTQSEMVRRAKAFAGEHNCILFHAEATRDTPRFERLNLDRSLVRWSSCG